MSGLVGRWYVLWCPSSTPASTDWTRGLSSRLDGQIYTRFNWSPLTLPLSASAPPPPRHVFSLKTELLDFSPHFKYLFHWVIYGVGNSILTQMVSLINIQIWVKYWHLKKYSYVLRAKWCNVRTGSWAGVTTADSIGQVSATLLVIIRHHRMYPVTFTTPNTPPLMGIN